MHPLLTPITKTDSYKASHFMQYPNDTQRISSYIEPRGGEFDDIVFFGLQAYIKQYLLTPITKEDVQAAQALFEAHGEPFNKEGWDIIIREHAGYLPVTISALPEGTVHKAGVPQVQVVNSDPRLPWLTSYIETSLLRAVWYPSTVASLSRRAKEFIMTGLNITADDPEAEIGFKLHDFGARGATCSEAAMLGGMAHLVNFMGTDTVEGLVGAIQYYNAEGPVGFSIPAAEHSTVTSWGKDGEYDMLENYLDKFPTGLLAWVCDSYNTYGALAHIGTKLKHKILSRDGTLVVRPDSGDPVAMPIEVIQTLMNYFGYETNEKGYKVLPPQIRVIQGDGMNLETIKNLMIGLENAGLSVSNIAMGMGGGLLQKVDRDTCKYAMKANARYDGANWHDVFKDPFTDQGKKSKRGRQAVLNIDGELAARKIDDLPTDMGHGIQDVLRPVYHNGELLIDEDFETIRSRAAV